MKLYAGTIQESDSLHSGIMCILALTLVVVFSSMSVAAEPDGDPKSIVDVTRDRAGAPVSPAAVVPLRREAPTLGKGDLYALVVGIANYKEPKLRLRVSDDDARSFAQFLETQKKVFRNVHVKLMVNDQATKMEVEKYLNYELARAGKDDTVMIFFSGHGAGDRLRPDEYYFLTYDADPIYLEATALKMTGLSFLKRISAPRVLLIADACHSGAISDGDLKSVAEPLDTLTRAFTESSGRVIMTSSKPDEFSREKPSLKQSVFTYYLLKGLRGEADTDRTGVVTLQGLYDYVYDHTKDETNGGQHPQLVGRIVGNFPIAVAGDLKEPISLEVSAVAQDPRCTNPSCTDPSEDATRCTDPLCGDVPITDGSTMYTRQNYQIGFRPSSTSYVYVYHIGSQGDIYRLFPGKKYLGPGNNLENPLKGGRIYWIPGKHNWLRQDNLQGDEKIYVVAARTKNNVLEDLYGYLEKMREQGRNPGQGKLVQNDLASYLHGTMSPTKAIIRKVDLDASATGVDPKTRQFEQISRHFYSSPGLDAVKCISIHHVGR